MSLPDDTAAKLRAHSEKVVPLMQDQVINDPNRRRIKATPFVLRDPSEIPPREFVYGRHYIRRFVTGTVAPGSVGKSTMVLVEAVAMASGRDLLGVPVREPLRVWYGNGEDPFEEIERRVTAICLHYGVTSEDLGDRLFINSGREEADGNGRGVEIVIAREDGKAGGLQIAVPVVEDLKATLIGNAIDVWMLDPFVSVHEVNENDNSRIGPIIKTFAQIADATNTSCELVHHTKKASGQDDENAALDARGAAAFVDRCRSVRALIRMTREQGDGFGLDTFAREHRKYFRVELGKANLSPPHAHTVWRTLVDQPLGNATDRLREDHIGVVCAWAPTDPMKGFGAADVLAIQKKIADGNYRWDRRADPWVGDLILDALEWGKTEAANINAVKKLLSDWVKSGLIEVVEDRDKKRNLRPFVRVRRWIEVNATVTD